MPEQHRFSQSFEPEASDANGYGTVHGGIILKFGCQASRKVLSEIGFPGQHVLKCLSRFDFRKTVSMDSTVHTVSEVISHDNEEIQVKTVLRDKYENLYATGLFVYKITQ